MQQFGLRGWDRWRQQLVPCLDVDDGPPARKKRADQSQLDQPPSLEFRHQNVKEKRKTELWTAQSMNFSGDGLVAIDGGRASGKWQITTVGPRDPRDRLELSL